MEIQDRTKKSAKILRITFYSIVIALIVTAVLWKRSAILRARTGEITSVFNEQSKYGIPVNAERVSLSDFHAWTRITAVPQEDGNLVSYMDAASKSSFKAGQRFRVLDSENGTEGQVTYVADDRSVKNYLYLIKLKPSKPLNPKAQFHALGVATSSYEKVIKIPEKAVFKEEDGSYVWKITDDAARKTKVKESYKDGTYAIIKEGLKPGDLIVTEGSDIREGIKLRVYKCENCN